jgi:hypothetical protein
MTDCNKVQMIFPFYKHKQLTVNFNGGDISSDGGLLFLRQCDDNLGITERMVNSLDDHRDQRYTIHQLQDLIRQRIYQIIAGYEDCNDATTLRHDPILKLSCDRQLEAGDDLASQPTLSRLENSVRASELYRLSETLLELFFSAHPEAPREIILDIDTTDDPTHGAQQLALFNGFYDQHMYHPLLVYEGTHGELLAALLRPGNVNSSRSASAILRRLIERLRTRWPTVRITARADGGFASPELYELFESEHVRYVLGFRTTEPLKLLNAKNLRKARREFRVSKTKVRLFSDTYYRARSWDKRRRVIMKTEVSAEGDNERFVVTNLRGGAEAVYDFYIQRGQVENQMIKELKLDIKADRLSCHRFTANQFRLLLHGFAYVLWHRLRQQLHGTPWATARIETLRLQLLKVGARVSKTFRRVWVELSSAYPFRELWYILFNRLCIAYADG